MIGKKHLFNEINNFRNKLSHNVYYVRMMAKRRLYNDLNLMSGVRLHKADTIKDAHAKSH